MDYDFLPVSDGNGDAALMHVTADRLTGATILEVDSVANVPSKFIATYGTLDVNGKITSVSKRDFKGHLSGGDIIIDDFEPGSTDAGNTIGQVVIIKPNTGWADRVATFIKNMTGFGTPEDITIANLDVEDITAETIITSGNATVGGGLSVTGNIDITGTSRLVPASVTTASGGNITPTKQVFNVTALDANATVLAPTWAALDGMVGELLIKDNGVSRTLTWPADWVPIGITLPTSTIAGKYMYINYRYNEVDDKFHVRGVARQT